MYVITPTAFSDVAKWAGGQRWGQLAADYYRGRLDFPQLVHEFIATASKDNLNTIVSSVRPELQAAYIALARQRLGPDVTDQRTIPDYEYTTAVVTQMLEPIAAELLTRTLRGPDYYPRRNTAEMWQQAILQVRRRDPEAVGFYATMDRIDDYGKKVPGSRTPMPTPQDDEPQMQEVKASFRRAIRAADVPAATRLYQRMLELGYTAEAFTSMVAQHPLSSLRKEHQQRFVDQLSPAERRDLNMAFRYADRIKSFRGRERTLFPPDRASKAYQEQFAARGGRPDVFAQVMAANAGRSDEEEDLRAEQLLGRALRR